MYIRRIYSPLQLLRWTRFDLAIFLGISFVSVFIFAVLGFHWAHLPWLPIALVGTAVAFILGFQNNASYDRAWEARKIWGGITNVSRTFGTMINDFVTDLFTEVPVSDGELDVIRRRMARRHIAWLTALRHAMRAERPWEQFGLYHTNREWRERVDAREHSMTLEEDIDGLLADEDWAAVKDKANPAAQIIALQSHELEALRRRGLIDCFRHMEMQNRLAEMLDLQGRSERIKNFPYPRQYATLNWLFVMIFVVLVPFGTVDAFWELGQELRDEHPLVAPWIVWLNVPFGALVMWVFHTTERIGRVTENPFEGSANDVPITTMARGIEIDLLQMIGEDPASIPAPIEPIDGVQS